MKRKLIYLLLVTVLVFVLAACGKDDEKEKTPDRIDETETSRGSHRVHFAGSLYEGRSVALCRRTDEDEQLYP